MTPSSGIGDVSSLSLVFLLPKASKLFGFHIFWPWGYILKVIPETRNQICIAILLTHEKQLHDNTISLKGFSWDIYMCVRGIDFAYISIICPLNFVSIAKVLKQIIFLMPDSKVLTQLL